MKSLAAKLRSLRLWLALGLGGLATIVSLPVGFGLEAIGAPPWLVGIFGAPLFLGALLGGNNVHSERFLLGMLAGFGVCALILSFLLLPLARWFLPDD